MTTFVAFVRGINVGGKTVKMDSLKKMFSSLGFTNISTYKASGNVVFDSDESASFITKKIENGLHKLIGSETHVILRKMDELKKIVASDPFSGGKFTPDARLYVTFLPADAKPKNEVREPPDKSYRMNLAGREIYTVLYPSAMTVDLMEMLDKEFGKVVTTRNWNTIVGIAK